MPAPTVLDTSPAANATDVVIGSLIIFDFDTDIDPTTVTSVSFFVFNVESVEAVVGQLSVSGARITFTPNRQLLENQTYRAQAMGLSSGSSEVIKSTTSDALVTDFSVTFRTIRERYVPLEEVTARSDIDAVAPIRVVPNELLLAPAGITEALVLDSSDPVPFKNVDTCLLKVVFDVNLAATGIDLTPFTMLEIEPVLGIPEYVADVDGAGQEWLKDCAPTGLLNGVTSPDFGSPTGIFSATGTNIVWDRGTGEPCFNFNEELIFTLKKGLPSSSGGTLAADVSVVYTTSFWPSFVGVRFVRTEMGPLARNFSDDTIGRVIHKNSIEAFEQSGRKFDPYEPFPAVRRFVSKKSVLDLIDYFALAVGEQEKQLGDLRIRSGDRQDQPRYKALVKEVAVLLKEIRWYRGQGRAQWVVKGDTAYNNRFDQLMRTWDNFGWWPGQMVPASNESLERHHKLTLAGDHGTIGAPPRRVLGPDGGLFICKQKT